MGQKDRKGTEMGSGDSNRNGKGTDSKGEMKGAERQEGNRETRTKSTEKVTGKEGKTGWEQR